jgi:transposase
MQIAVLGIHLGKNSCSLVGLVSQGTIVKRRRMRPTSIVGFTKGLPPCIIAKEVLLWRASPRPPS